MKLKNASMLFLTAIIWGCAFVAQSVGMNDVGPFTFGFTRMFIGVFVLLPVIAIFGNDKASEYDSIVSDGTNKSESDLKKDRKKEERKNLLNGGLICGVCLFIASAFQQIGIIYTTPGKAGFITALYIILVPIIGIFLKKKCSPVIWLCVVLAVIGFYLLCIGEDFALQKGDFYELVCSLFFAMQILAVDFYSPKVNGVKLSCAQFLVAGILNLIVCLALEEPTWAGIYAARIPILYTGVLSSGVAYTLQIIGQKGVNPTLASLIMSLESVVSVVASAIILKQFMSGRELLGCVVIFTSIIIAQIPWNELVKKNGA